MSQLMAIQDLTDEVLVLRTKDGDAEAFGALFERHKDVVYNFAFCSLGNDADAQDATQTIFVKAFKMLEGFRGECLFRTWLFTIAHSKVADFTKKRLPFPLEPKHKALREYPAPGNGVDGEVIRNEKMKLVKEAVLELEPEKRTIILLRDFVGISYGELSAIVGAPVNTVRVRLHRARMELKEKLVRAAVI